MDTNAFRNLLNDEVIANIDIDPRLIPSFKRVIEKLATIFEANEYLELKDYNEFFNKFLIHNEDTRPKMTITINDDPSKIDASGFYNKSKNNITIDRTTYERLTKLGNMEELDHILFHEFTHFLVMHDLSIVDSNEQIYRGGFINEALTEMFTINAYQEGKYYEPQVSMLRFANLISGNTNNFRAFLRGRVDAKRCSAAWQNFEESVNNYQKEFETKGFRIEEARKNIHFITAQRNLIATYYSPQTVDTLDKYFDMVEKLSTRPIEDKEAIDHLLKCVEQDLLRKYLNGSSEVKSSFESLFKSVHEAMDNLKLYGDTPVYEFDFQDEHIVLDEFGNFVKPFIQVNGNGAQHGQIGSIVNIYLRGENTSVNLNSVPFISYKNKLEVLKTKLTSLLTPTTRKDIEAIDKVAGTDKELIRLERFTLPIIGFDKTQPKTVYIAYYPTGTQVLTDYPSIGNVDKVNVDKYIGLTSTNPTQALIVRDTICEDAPGVIYTTATKKYIEHLAHDLVQKQMEENLTEENKLRIFAAFKTTPDYDETLGEEQGIEDAMYWYSKLRLNSLSDDKKEKLYTVFKNQADKFIVTVINGVVSVAKLETPNIAYIAEKEVLVDNRYPSFYNIYYEEKKKQHHISVTNDELITELEDGTLSVNTKRASISSTSVEDILTETRTLEGLTEEVKARLL